MVQIKAVPGFKKDMKKLGVKPEIFMAGEGEYEPTFLENYILWPAERVWDGITDSFREIKWFIQRGKRGYADSDLWSLDYYLSGWLPDALRELKKIQNGYPASLTRKEWDKILDEMIEGFEIANGQDDIYCIEANGKPILAHGGNINKYKKLEKKRIKKMELFVKWYRNLWW